MNNNSSAAPARKAIKWSDDSSDDDTSEISNESHRLSRGDDVSLFQGYLVVNFGSLFLL